MKGTSTLFLVLILLFACGAPDTNGSMDSNPENKNVKKTASSIPDDDRVSGYFNLIVGDKTYKSSQLQDNYCDMTFNYNEEKSFVAIRFRDVESRDALLVSIYGDEEFISTPEGKIETFMFSGPAKRKVNIQFMPGDGKGSMNSTTIIEGSCMISKFGEGNIEASFEGSGALPKDVVTKQNLITFKGEIDLKTKNVTKLGLD